MTVVQARTRLAAPSGEIKTATSSLLWHLEQIGEPPVQVGSYGIVADRADTPICILELTEVEIKPFNVAR